MTGEREKRRQMLQFAAVVVAVVAAAVVFHTYRVAQKRPLPAPFPAFGVGEFSMAEINL